MVRVHGRLRDEFIVKRFADCGFKIIYMKVCRQAGVPVNRRKKGAVNEQKLANNISRAKTKVMEYALVNDWDWWCTFTISPQKFDRHNLDAYQKAFSEFLHGYNRRAKAEEKVKYLLVPEQHEDGAWHMHGFLKGVREGDIALNEHGRLTWLPYNEHFGFMTMELIRDKAKAASYLVKYMNKNMDEAVSELGAHSYYASKGLKHAEVIYRGMGACSEWDFKGEYCSIKWCKTEEDLKKVFVDYENKVSASME